MSVMIEIYYRKPDDPKRELKIMSCVSDCDGKVTYREDDSVESICLTAEFASWEMAQAACVKLRESGEHVEGPTEYGDK